MAQPRPHGLCFCSFEYVLVIVFFVLFVLFDYLLKWKWPEDLNPVFLSLTYLI